MRNWDMDTAFAVINSLNAAQVAEHEAIFNIGDVADHCYNLAKSHLELDEYLNHCENDGNCSYNEYELIYMAKDIVHQRFLRVHELLVEKYTV